MAKLDPFLAAWDALPDGSFDGIFDGRRYGVTKTVRQGGRQGWIWAEELGGSDRISGNLYRLKSGARLKPCEMPEAKVQDFVFRVTPVKSQDILPH